MPLLVDHAKHKEENIRNIVAENIGRLFVHHSDKIFSDLDNCLKNPNSMIRSTIVRSFKYSANKATDQMQLELLMTEFNACLFDSDIQVRRNALESLNSIVHNVPGIIKNDLDQILKAVLDETVVKTELIHEVDLGPFKHKVDDGMPLRRAAFSVLDSIIEKIPERVNIQSLLEAVMRGLDDPLDECQSQCHHLVIRLIRWAPGALFASADKMVELLDKSMQKSLKQIASN